MKQKSIQSLLMATIVAIITLASCDSSADSYVTSDPSRDCVITSATLGTLKRIVTTKDTTYRYSVTGGAYLLYIDQVNYKVYNPDSLPVGTCTDKLVFATNGLLYSGSIAIQSLTSKQDTTFVPTDSTDFSVPRLVTVYAEDGQSKRTYTFDIRVHQQDGDTIVWKQLAHNPLSPLASFVKQKTIVVDNMLYVFGQTADGKLKLIPTNIDTPDFNDVAELNGSVDVSSIRCLNDAFYALSNKQLFKFVPTDNSWISVETNTRIDALVGVCGDSLYAIADNQMIATTDGMQWMLSAKEGTESLPTENIAYAVQSAKNNKGVETALLVGENNGKTSVWKHDLSANGNIANPWISIPQTDELKTYVCPTLKDANLFAYDSKMVLVGKEDDNTITPFYVSEDNGRTWKTGSLSHPTTTDVAAVSVVCDKHYNIWIVCSGSGDVYRGRLNRLLWDENQTRFE